MTARAAALVACVIGLGLSTYLTIEHYSSSLTLACPETGTVNCLKVTTSSWSVLLGVPVAALGLAYFAVMTALVALPARDPRLSTVRVLGGAVGVATALFLVYVELFEVDAICLWCTGVHVVTLVLFGLLLWDHTSSSAQQR